MDLRPHELLEWEKMSAQAGAEVVLRAWSILTTQAGEWVNPYIEGAHHGLKNRCLLRVGADRSSGD